MPTHSSPRRWMRRLPGTLVLCGVLLAALAGCSLTGGSGSGSSSLSLGLAGSTADKPASPPSLAQGGPGGEYAFVFDNQVWLRTPSQPLKQLTHLVLSNGANIAWGPLVWSASGKYIAFSLVQSLNPTERSSSSGPIYIVDTASGSTILSGGTGSIYGHTYAWYGDNMLFFSSGGSIDMFGPFGCNTTCDPRTWTAVSPVQAQGGGVYSGQSVAYGDIGITGSTLYFTQVSLTSLGDTGVVGSAAVQRIQIDIASDDVLPGDDATSFPLPGYAAQVADLGQAYAGSQGSVSAGVWDLSDNGIVVQHIDGVDAKANRVSSSFCSYDAYGNCTTILRDAGTAPLSATPGISVAGGRVAYTDGTLYTASAADGSRESKLANAGWTMPPVVSPDGKLVAVTQLVKQSTAATGVVHSDTNVLIYNGSTSLTFVPGGQDFSWKS